MFRNFFFLNRAICEIIWKNTVSADRPQMKIWCMGVAWWIPNATYTLSEYVLLHCSNGCTVRTRLSVTWYAHCLS